MIRTIIGTVLGALGGLTCTAAGIYMLSFQSRAAAESGVYDLNATDFMLHGVGLYALGKGIAILSSTTFRSGSRAPATS